ncbi:MAG: endopeptidase La [Verrucomicrobiota bacterium]
MSDTEFIRIHGVTRLGQDGGGKPPVKTGPDILPVLGLSDIVFFPGMVAPLLVEFGPSVKLIDDVVGGNRLLALVFQRKPEAENPTPAELHGVGCVGRVLKMLKFPDNTVRVLVEGVRRVRLVAYPGLEPYLRAEVETIKEVVEESVELEAIARNAQGKFQDILKQSPALGEQVKVAALNASDPGNLSDLIAPNLNLSLAERQNLLETANVKDRLNHLLPFLQRELEVLAVGTKIQNEVANSMSKSQRDFFLREQMRAIQRELGEADPNAVEITQLRERIEKSKLPEDVHKAALKELERLQQMPPAVAEYTVSRNYLDWVLDLPWNQTTEDKFDLHQAEQLLDQQHYGLHKVKERLLEYLAVLRLRRGIKGPILCLVGPPGVGKTSLGKSLAEALGRKFIRISLGGMRDEAEIRGHRRTYVGAMPGRIIQSLRRVGTRNPVILLDELDKVGADFRGDPAAALLEVLDPAQNNTFTDNYLDLPFDLSQVLFLTTANWLDPVHVALRDRLEVIELPSYTATEKLEIACRHLLPRQFEEHGLLARQVKIPRATLRQVIRGYTREAGVRQLEREIAALLRKAARRLADQSTPAPVSLFTKDLVEMLGQPKFQPEIAEKITSAGIAMGLAWTPVGGEILFIEATRMPGTGRLILTGSLGEVMKESAQTAHSFLRSQSKKLNIEFTDYDKTDIHIHVPAGATPKDGPSAGATIVVALASLLSKRCVRSDVALTGEISLRGRVLRVGGIKEKVMAAARSGVKCVILPAENRSDWSEVPLEVRQRMKVHFAHQISELFPLALRKQ